MTNIFKFIKGLMIKPKTGSSEADSAGELEVLSSDGKLRYHNGSSSSPVVTESHTATLTNKTIDANGTGNSISNLETADLAAGVLNTSTTLSGATDTQLPSALAVKTYVDDKTAAQNEASEISFTPAGTIVATNVQAAIEELDGDIQGHITDTTDAHDASAISVVPVGNLVATDVQSALAELDGDIDIVGSDLGAHIVDAIDAHDASAISNVPAGTIAATDVQAAINELDGDIQGHITDTTDAHDASAISVVATGNLTSTDVQSALVELQGEADTANTHIAASQDVHGIGVGSSVVGTATSQTLTNKIITGADIRTPVRSDVKQDTQANLTTYATTATNGQLCFATDTKIMYQVVDGLLVDVGSGGGAADVNALLIQTYDDSATSDFTQTGLALVTSNTINGAQTARLIHQAGSSQSFKEIKAVDRKFRNKLMTMSLALQSTASEGNVTVNIYDETNAANIVASEALTIDSQAISSLSTASNTTISGFTNSSINSLSIGMRVTGSGIQTGTLITAINPTALTVTISQNATATASGLTLRFSSLPERRTLGFTIPASCASLSYTITALQESGSPETYVDDTVIELAETALLETSVEVPVVTAWQGYTPTFQGFGTPTNVEFEWRQVGENVEIRGKFVSGVSTAVQAQVGLPAGYTSAATDLIPSIQVNGFWLNSANNANHGGAVLISPSLTYVNFGPRGTFGSAVETPLAPQNANAMVSSGEAISFSTSVPILGLSATTATTIPLTQSGIVQEADSMVRVDTANGYGSTATRIRRFSNIRESLGSAILYQDSATLGGSFTVQESGIYEISYSDQFSASATLGISKNSSQLTTNIDTITVADRLALSQTSGANVRANVSWQGQLVAGDVIRAHSEGTSVGSNSANVHFTIARQGSLSQVSVSADQKITIPTSELRFEGASARGAVATAIVKFDTLAKIRGDAFTVVSDATNGTAITMTKAGKLEIGASLLAASSCRIDLTRNQAVLTASPSSASEILSTQEVDNATARGSVSWSGFVNIGDVIRVSTSVTPTANVTNNLNLSFQEQSVQVSVSNTLPQFSESDSSVRVDTANGYGSTATRIRRFSNVRDNIGTDIEYVDSATNGASFTVRESGEYAISYSDQFSASATLGISKNSSQLTTNIDTITVADRLALSQTSGANVRANVSWQGQLVAGDVIRAHSEGTSVGSNSANVHFTISKVGKPNVTGVDVTPFVNIPQPDVEVITIPRTSTALIDNTGEIRFSTSVFTSTNKGILRVEDDSVGARTKFTALKRCLVNLYFSAQIPIGSTIDVFRNGNLYSNGNESYKSNGFTNTATTVVLEAGEFLSLSGAIVVPYMLNITAESQSTQILTAPQTFSTDTAALQYASSAAYTLSTLANAPVGTYITFTYAASTNTRTQTTTRPTQTDANMNANGIQVFTRTWAGTSTAASPSTFAIQIGKGMKGYSLDAYKSTSKTTAGDVDNDIFDSGTIQEGVRFKSYDEVTGILMIDAGYTYGSVTLARFKFADLTTQNNAYLVINASTNPALTGLNVLQPRIAYLKDVKSAGTQGGTFTSGAWQTRTLNTLEGDVGIVSLSSNQFTLSPGSYDIEASAPGHIVAAHQAKIRNITDSTDAIIGGNVNAPTDTTTLSIVRGTITLTTSKTFELQHQSQVTQATNGFGNANAFGTSQVYSQVRITKVK